MFFKPSSAHNYFVLTKVEDQERLIQVLLSSHNQVQFNSVCNLWFCCSIESPGLCDIFQWFSGDVVEVC